MLRATISLGAPSEGLNSIEITVKVDHETRPLANVPVGTETYVIEGLSHGNNVWVDVTYIDLVGNRSSPGQLHFVASDSTPPATPTVTLVSIEQVA